MSSQAKVEKIQSIYKLYKKSDVAWEIFKSP